MSTPTDLNEYLLFFRGPDWDAGLTLEQTEEILAQITVWFERMQRQGKVKGGQVLQRRGKTVASTPERGPIVSDGPFAETKEAVGGYLAVFAKDLDEAVAMAREFPTLNHGISIDIRPVGDECPITKRVRERRALIPA
jgi:hypothetical protein